MPAGNWFWCETTQDQSGYITAACRSVCDGVLCYGLLWLAHEWNAAGHVYVQGYGIGQGNWNDVIAAGDIDGDAMKWPIRWVWRMGFMIAILAALHVLSQAVNAQNIATAKGPGSYIAIGGEVSAFQADYGQRVIYGGGLFADVNPT